MRIRTIKPDFWKHHGMSQLPADTRLLAIGLLNFADDEGYFNAHPALIRGELMPFEEKTKHIPLMLEALERVGYISLTTGADGMPLGKVVNFIKHQRINRPTKSKHSRTTHSPLSESSVSPYGEVTDDSLWEGNREQGTGKGREREREKEAPGGGPLNILEAHEHARKWCLSSPAMIAYDPVQVEMWHADRERKSWQSSAGQIIQTSEQAKKDLQFWLLRNKTSATPDSMNGFGAKKKKGGAAEVMPSAPAITVEDAPEGYEAAMEALWGAGWEQCMPGWGPMKATDKAQVREWIKNNQHTSKA